jgi:hypothetical protein
LKGIKDLGRKKGRKWTKENGEERMMNGGTRGEK